MQFLQSILILIVFPMVLVLVFSGLRLYVKFKNARREFLSLTDTKDLEKRIDRLVADYVKRRPKVRLSIGLTHKGKRYFKSFAGEEAEPSEAREGEHLYQLGSITKTMTGLLLAILKHEGVVDYNDPIRKYLPSDLNLAESVGNITLEQLSTHTSGLPRLPQDFDSYVKDKQNPYVDFHKEQLFESLQKVRLKRKPGSATEYSNLGVGLLGFVLECATGKTFQQLIKTKIAEPLGMVSLISTHPDAPLLPCYDDKSSPTKAWELDALAGCGSLCANVQDMLTYLEALLNPDSSPLEPSLQDALVPHYQPKSMFQREVGLGWHIQTELVSKLKMHWHNGGTGGFTTFCGMVLEENLGVVVLSNYGDAMANDESVDRFGLYLLEIGSKVSLADTLPSETINA